MIHQQSVFKRWPMETESVQAIITSLDNTIAI